jgi:hypothetical protein
VNPGVIKEMQRRKYPRELKLKWRAENEDIGHFSVDTPRALHMSFDNFATVC